jgi:hypothetical protein
MNEKNECPVSYRLVEANKSEYLFVEEGTL